MRQAVKHLQAQHRFAERRACRVMVLARGTVR